MLLANVFIPAVINELTLFLQQKMMIKNHINALRVRILFKGTSIKTWVKGTRKQQKTIQCKIKSKKWDLSILYIWFLYPTYPLRCRTAQTNSLKLFIISYTSRRRLAARPDCSPHSWPRWWHCLSFRPPFAYNQLFYHNFVWQTVCVFLRSAWLSDETWTAPDYEGNASAMWWEYTWKVKTVTIATS